MHCSRQSNGLVRKISVNGCELSIECLSDFWKHRASESKWPEGSHLPNQIIVNNNQDKRGLTGEGGMDGDDEQVGEGREEQEEEGRKRWRRERKGHLVEGQEVIGNDQRVGGGRNESDQSGWKANLEGGREGGRVRPLFGSSTQLTAYQLLINHAPPLHPSCNICYRFGADFTFLISSVDIWERWTITYSPEGQFLSFWK